MVDPNIRTKRLIIRPWKEEDFDSFARFNADPRVMEFFPRVLTQEESNLLAKRICKAIEDNGFGFYAVSIPNVSDFIGFIGLNRVDFNSHFTPAVEIGWRLGYEFWNKGYATEGAEAVLRYGFENHHLNEIVSLTAVNNMRSRRVMEKIGMYRDDTGDFNHPRCADSDPLQRHTLYRIRTGHFTKISELPPENFKARVEVAACYLEINGRILLMERAPDSAEGKTWGVPAGKIELGETPHQAALRELNEETGIQASSLQIEKIGKLYVKKPRGDYIYHMFQVKLNDTPKVILSSEHTQYLWANRDEINSLDLIGGGRESLNYFARMKK